VSVTRHGGGRLPSLRRAVEHLAFEVERREEVDEAFERCRQLGARIHYPPEEDRDLDDYYAFFVFDPDGFRIEVFCAKQAEGPEGRWTTKLIGASRAPGGSEFRLSEPRQVASPGSAEGRAGPREAQPFVRSSLTLSGA
jgi:Glyoxalase/Bleomycin resistance protein/Dioxygenase superfamily